MKTIKEKNIGLFNAVERVLTKRLSNAENYMNDFLIELYKKYKIDDESLSLLMDELELTRILLEIIGEENETNLEIKVSYRWEDAYRFYIKGTKEGQGYNVFKDDNGYFQYEADWTDEEFENFVDTFRESAKRWIKGE